MGRSIQMKHKGILLAIALAGSMAMTSSGLAGTQAPQCMPVPSQQSVKATAPEIDTCQQVRTGGFMEWVINHLTRESLRSKFFGAVISGRK